MAVTYPKSTERRVYGMIRAGHTINIIAQRAGVSPGYVKERRRRLAERHRAMTEKKMQSELPDPEDEDTGPIPPERWSPIAQDCAEDFARFRARYFGRISTPWQEDAAQRVARLLGTDDEEYLVVNCPPGSGKSTLFTHDIPAWLTVRDRTIRGLMGSYGERVASAYTSRLRSTFQRTVPMQAKLNERRRGLAIDAEAALAGDYGGFKPATQEVWRREQFTVAQYGETSTDEKESTWTAFGKDSGSLGWRVNFINWDDLFTVRMRTAEVIQDLKDWWDSEAEQRLEPGGLLVLQGQRLRADDIYRYALDKVLWTDEIAGEDVDGGIQQYHHIVYKAHYENRCRADEDKAWHDTHAEPYDPTITDDEYDANPTGGCLLDPQRVSWKKCRSAISQGNYQTVYQQEDADPAKALVRRAWVDGGLDPFDNIEYPGCWDEDRALTEIPPIYGAAFTVRYITIDPSPTKYWSIQDWLYVLPDAVDPMGGFRFLLNHVRDKYGANELLDWVNAEQRWSGVLDDWVMAAKASGYPATHLIMEKNAAQRWAMQYEHFTRWQIARGVNVLPHETTNNKNDPQLGVEQSVPQPWKFGRVRLPGKGMMARQAANQLVIEVTKWPTWPTDDCVMAHWFGEFHLQHLVHLRRPIGSIHTDMPSWAKRMEMTGV